MRTQENRKAFRRYTDTGRKKERQKDSVAAMLSGQVAVSLLFILLAFVLRDARPALWQPLREQYIQLLTRPMQSEEWGWGEGLGGWYTSLRTQALDQVSDVVTRLIGEAGGSAQEVAVEPPTTPVISAAPQEQGQEQEQEQDAVFPTASPTTALAISAQVIPEQLNGAGGWFGGGSDVRQAPSGCSTAPILLTHRMEAPVGGKVTSLFGWREHPITGEQDFHRGLDIAAALGSRIATPLAGVVQEVGESAIYGNFVTVDHGAGIQTSYAHCATIEVAQGVRLRAGEMVATVGNTGISTGPHLHFELRKDGVFYNPLWGLFAPSMWQDVRNGD